jgi:hypothetical protein
MVFVQAYAHLEYTFFDLCRNRRGDGNHECGHQGKGFELHICLQMEFFGVAMAQTTDVNAPFVD